MAPCFLKRAYRLPAELADSNAMSRPCPKAPSYSPSSRLLKLADRFWQCQWIETALLNIINFQTLIATKAARIAQAAKGGDLSEFGFEERRDSTGRFRPRGLLSSAGANATSNLLASRLFGIPARGTHAHSWVMSFDSEQEAFDEYAQALPDRCVLLVDTTTPSAESRTRSKRGRSSPRADRQLGGVRLDSGDLAYLSAEVRKMLDDAGLNSTRIVASNELDEHLDPVSPSSGCENRRPGESAPSW